MVYSAVRHFTELPLSNRTRQALSENGFTRLTDIQRAAIPHALAGRDVLGAARTGSGKTLAFLIPVLERLWRLQWSRSDGLGALILSPTRELALQIFDVLRVVGVHHTFSAGLVIGGKSVEEEQARINAMNILVATPGRLLQHLDQTYGFDVSNLQMLVLDEADRILDLGFSSTLNDIVASLPAQRQSLLFSATQTKSVRDLARLSLASPEYLAVHEADVLATPDKLEQHYVVVQAERKLDLLFSFIKTHLRAKTLVFVSAGKQVRFLYEMFRRVRPGVPLLHLHGKMSQAKRMALYYQFCDKKQVVLFATDVAARGLDFPDVDWVLQVDAPDSVQTYIHRVGRTARYRAGGKALLFILPSELALIDKAVQAKVALQQTKVNPSQVRSIASTFQAFMVEDNELKFLGQKALLAYLKSVYLQRDKDTFDLTKLDVHAMALAMGLPSAPKLSIKLSNGGEKEKNRPYQLRELEEGGKGKKKGKKKAGEDERGMSEMDRLLGRRNQGVLSEARLRLLAESGEGGGEASDDEEVLTVKRKNHDLDDEEAAAGGASASEDDEEEGKEGASDAAVRGGRLLVKGEEVEDEEEEEEGWLDHVKRALQDEDATDKQREHDRSAAAQPLSTPQCSAQASCVTPCLMLMRHAVLLLCDVPWCSVHAKHQLRRMKEKKYNMRKHVSCTHISTRMLLASSAVTVRSPFVQSCCR